MERELADFLKIIRQRLWWIAATVLIAELAAVFFVYFMFVPQYAATATLLVQPQNPVGSQISYDDLITNEKLVATFGQIIKSKKIAREVIHQLSLPISESKLLKNVEVKGLGDSLVTAITVVSTDPVQAANIANEFARSFQKYLPVLMKVENVSMLDEAYVEENPDPVFPQPPFILTVVFFIAFTAAAGIAILRELLDKTIKSEEEINRLLDKPALGTIPRHCSRKKSSMQSGEQPSRSNRRERLFCLDDSRSPVAETFRTLRTNIRYMGARKSMRTLLVTSALPEEGKTSVVSNLAVAMAQEGHNVLLMDCDLRKPRLHKIFNISGHNGLSNLLIGEGEMDDLIVHTWQNNLSVLPAGPLPPNPSELLGTTAMAEILQTLKQCFDYILIDSSPLIPVTDAQLLGKQVDGVILVVRSGKSLRTNVKKAVYLLNHVGALLIGSVLNGKKMKVPIYYK